MNPPWPRRTVLTRTELLAPGRTTTSPALTSPAKTTSSTDDDNTARDDRLHPQHKHDMYGMCTKGKVGRPTRVDEQDAERLCKENTLLSMRSPWTARPRPPEQPVPSFSRHSGWLPGNG